VAYLSGALTGGFGAVAVVAARRGEWTRGLLAVLVALATGALAVVAEERASRAENPRPTG
jgi:hypothetical protein